MKNMVRVLVLSMLLFVGMEGIHAASPLLKTGSLAWADNAAVGAFHDALLPYGEWVWSPRYGSVWSPYNVPVNWRPYTRGRWIDSDYGWTWSSSEPWGWACYHYGRWYDDDTYGWVWYPGTVWAPAWVCWRYTDDWVGWAPLPPDIGWNDEFGLDLGGINLDIIIPISEFSFCEERYFLDDNIDRYIALTARNITIGRNTRAFCDFGRENGRIINRLPVEKRLGQILGRPVPRYRVGNADLPDSPRFKGKQANFFRPNLKTAAENGGRIKSGNGTAGKTPVPPELNRRQQQEQQALRQQEEMQKQTLQEQQRSETKNPPAGLTREQITRQTQAENRALEQQTTRENQLLNNWHQRERMVTPAPSTEGRKWNFSNFGNRSSGASESSSGKIGSPDKGSSSESGRASGGSNLSNNNGSSSGNDNSSQDKGKSSGKKDNRR